MKAGAVRGGLVIGRLEDDFLSPLDGSVVRKRIVAVSFGS